MWISDGVLTAAFNRSYLVSRTWHRKASNIPGPLESQRRLGKRQFGALDGLTCSPSPLPWAFSTPPNLSRWKWEPPSVLGLGTSRQGRDQAGAVDPSEAPQNWEAETARERLPSLSAPATRQTVPFQSDLDHLFWSVEAAPVELVVSDVNNIARKLEQCIFLGYIPPGEVVSIAEEIWCALDRRFESSSHSSHIFLALYSAIVTGVTTSKVFRPDLLDASFWSTLLLRMSQLSVTADLYGLFTRVISATQHLPDGALVKAVLPMLRRFFSAWDSPEGAIDRDMVSCQLESAASSCSRAQKVLDTLQPGLSDATTMLSVQRARAELQQARSCLASAESVLFTRIFEVRGLSEALAAVRPTARVCLLDAATRVIEKRARVSTARRYELRYSWLSVLAQLHSVKQESLFNAIKRLSSSALWAKPLSATELCSLLIAQWASRGYLRFPDKVVRAFESYCSGHEPTALASLVLAVFRSSMDPHSRNGIYVSLWRILAGLGRTNDMLNSLRALSYTRRVPRDLLGALCRASRDHHVVLGLKGLYVRHVRRPGGPDWDPALFGRHAGKIALDPLLPVKTIWQALDIPWLNRWVDDLPAKRARHRGNYGAQRAKIVARLALLLGDVCHRPRSVNFRQVAQCVRFLEEVKGGETAPGIRALYRVVTRDMLEGRPGITSRLLWFLRVVERNHGTHLSIACRRALQSWRFELRQIWLEQGGSGRTHGGKQ